MEQAKKSLNTFLVDTFNSLLRIEEEQLSKGEFDNISVKEMHVIEIVINSKDDNSAKHIAKELNITQGSLTTAVSTLEKKGMLIRKAYEKDKRIVKIYATEKAMKLYDHHMKFHAELVDAVTTVLSGEELEVFIKGLDKVRQFFDSKR